MAILLYFMWTERSIARLLYTQNLFVYLLMWFDSVTLGKNTQGSGSWTTRDKWEGSQEEWDDDRMHYHLMQENWIRGFWKFLFTLFLVAGLWMSFFNKPITSFSYNGNPVPSGTEIITIKENADSAYEYVSTSYAKEGEYKYGGLGLGVEFNANNHYYEGAYAAACYDGNPPLDNPVQKIVGREPQ